MKSTRFEIRGTRGRVVDAVSGGHGPPYLTLLPKIIPLPGFGTLVS